MGVTQESAGSACNPGDSIDVDLTTEVQSLCDDEDQTSTNCDISVDSETLKIDPCRGSIKSLVLSYMCEDDEGNLALSDAEEMVEIEIDKTISVNVCAGSRLEIACPEGTKVHMMSALYGRVPEDSTCLNGPAVAEDICGDELGNIFNYADDSCKNRSGCSVQFSTLKLSTIITDAAAKFDKYFKCKPYTAVKYTCKSTPVEVTVIAGPSMSSMTAGPPGPSTSSMTAGPPVG